MGPLYTIDSLVGLGDFAEIAIMTDDAAATNELEIECWQLANKLGLLPEKQEHRSYRQLLGF